MAGNIAAVDDLMARAAEVLTEHPFWHSSQVVKHMLLHRDTYEVYDADIPVLNAWAATGCAPEEFHVHVGFCRKWETFNFFWTVERRYDRGVTPRQIAFGEFNSQDEDVLLTCDVYREEQQEAEQEWFRREEEDPRW